ncbi:uncharacterized protein LOC134784115 [Penaeus indicus]|uniref:uncharacterized protein LOC134784115 n=1 Tax=Penaeus indicus TaxID=29960 RepID=UPI00300C07CE
MPGRSTTDAIFALRQLMEKYREGQRELHSVFIDLEKAYDRVPRSEVWNCLRLKEVDEKYVRIIQDMYEGTTTKVKSIVGTTDSFQVKVGLHQGSALSPFLFALVIDCLTVAVQRTAPWDLMYADDLCKKPNLLCKKPNLLYKKPNLLYKKPNLLCKKPNLEIFRYHGNEDKGKVSERILEATKTVTIPEQELLTIKYRKVIKGRDKNYSMSTLNIKMGSSQKAIKTDVANSLTAMATEAFYIIVTLVTAITANHP